MPPGSINLADPKFERNSGTINIGHRVNISYQRGEDCFELTNLELNIWTEYVPPLFTQDVQDKLFVNRLLFLWGGDDLNKDDFMKYIAYRFKENQTIVCVKESRGIPYAKNLLNDIRNESKSCIFLVYRTNPGSLEYSVEEIKKAAASRGHYVLVSTDHAKEAWHFPEGNDGIWYEVKSGNAYSEKQLEECFQICLKKLGLTWPKYIDPNTIISELKTVEGIELFFDKIDSKGKITEESIYTCIQYVSSIKLGIEKWFQNLENDQKLLALGLTFCNGLHEWQFFEVMDILILKGWAGRNHQLKPIDYKDIEPLLQYFKLENGYILNRNPSQGVDLLKIAWKTHKRFIHATISVITDLVNESTSYNKINWRLFGTPWKRRLFRQVITSSFYQLGKIDFYGVEFALISLAANKSADARSVTGDVLANLRHNMGDDWYRVLDTWQKSIEKQEFVSSLLEKDRLNDDNDTAALNHIEATITTALTAASLKDTPNELDYRILELVKRLTHSAYEKDLLLKSLQEALYWMSVRHTTQLSEVFRDYFLQYDYFVDHIAAGLAECYNDIDALAARDVILSWIDYANRNINTRKDHNVFLHDDRVLCCAILALKQIRYDLEAADSKVSIEEAYVILDDLRRHNHHPVVRKLLLKSIVGLIEQQSRQPSQQTINYISNLDEKECEQLVVEFEEQYVRQRASQSGGDYRLTIKGKKILIWNNPSDRPITEVELLMKEWLNHPDGTIKQIATRSIFAFHNVKNQENEDVQVYRETQRRLKEIHEELKDAPDPIYEAESKPDDYTKVFIKVALSITLSEHAEKVEKIAPLLLQGPSVSDEKLIDLLRYFDDLNSDKDKREQEFLYLYNLFTHKDLEAQHNPFKITFWSRSLIFLAETFLNFTAHNHIVGWAPILIHHRSVNQQDVKIVLSRWGDIGQKINKYVIICRILDRYPWLIVVLLIMIYILF